MKRKNLFQINCKVMDLKKRYPILLLSLIICCSSGITQEVELIAPRLVTSYIKFGDGTKQIVVSLTAREEGQRVSIENANLQIFALNGPDKIFLGDIFTDNHGKANLDINPSKSLPRNQDETCTFEILYKGSEKYVEASSTLEITDVILEISFSEIDSVKTVIAQVYQFDESGEKTFISAVPVEFYINRLFSLYRFGGEETDLSGTCAVEFPKKMPGDTAGNLLVIAKILDHEKFGTIEKNQEINWGQPLVIEPKPTRGLGDTDAPLWMVYTLLVLLTGVWLHVMYVIGLVIWINIIGRRALKQNS
ncbi:MAG: hypothetical protein V1733_02375 [bacterium]